jgi:riboflavin kinase / FMN adenylyltransferase
VDGGLQIYQGIEGLRAIPRVSVMSIGNFDGMHRGHAEILRQSREIAGKDKPVVIVTFEPHPMTVLRPDKAPPRLTPIEIKRTLLREHGADGLVVLAPTTEVLNLSAEAFWVILRDAGVAHLVEGETFNFGKDRHGDIRTLAEWTRRDGVGLTIVDPVDVVLLDLTVVPVSSSLIRWLLENGRAREAAICLGRAYSIRGKVVEGNHRGRTIGVPTANLDVTDQLIPADGVYAARCEIDGKNYPVALSIGILPTFDGKARQVEAHVIGFDGDLYGKTLGVEVVDWVREQRKFAGVEALKEQLQRDIAEACKRAPTAPERAIAHARVGS